MLLFFYFFVKCPLHFGRRYDIIFKVQYASVAQLDRAMASDAMCRWFESSQAYHFLKEVDCCKAVDFFC